MEDTQKVGILDTEDKAKQMRWQVPASPKLLHLHIHDKLEKLDCVQHF